MYSLEPYINKMYDYAIQILATNDFTNKNDKRFYEWFAMISWIVENDKEMSDDLIIRARRGVKEDVIRYQRKNNNRRIN